MTQGGRFDGESESFVVNCLDSHMGMGGPDDNAAQANHLIAHCLRGEGFDASEDGTGRGIPLVAGFKRGQGTAARSDGWQVEQCPTLTASDSGTQQSPGVQIGYAVRRLMPIECERVQGLPDDWTRWGADGMELSDSARYRMLGNAVTKTVAQYIGRRILESLKANP